MAGFFCRLIRPDRATRLLSRRRYTDTPINANALHWAIVFDSKALFAACRYKLPSENKRGIISDSSAFGRVYPVHRLAYPNCGDFVDSRLFRQVNFWRLSRSIPFFQRSEKVDMNTEAVNPKAADRGKISLGKNFCGGWKNSI